ncbi:hypothetical protein DEU38_1156 [Rhodococcus sp. AG1013]|nr:hypothetical protein DEU38_1156 [Rhodococcus sp. AG1013]
MTVGAAIKGGADVSVTVRLDPKDRAAIAQIEADAWFPIEYTTTDHAELGTGTADKTHRLLWLDWRLRRRRPGLLQLQGPFYYAL